MTAARIAILGLSLGAWACSGNPIGPTAGNSVVIRIVGINGAMSFFPDPGEVAPGQTVVWYNGDTAGHRIALDNGEAETDFLRPDATSHPIQIKGGAHYHCTIHPDMVGVLVPIP